MTHMSVVEFWNQSHSCVASPLYLHLLDSSPTNQLAVSRVTDWSTRRL